MRRWVVLVAGVVLLAALALVIVPVYSRGDAPRTVEEQAESIADTWAAWLWDDCGEALTPETIAGPRKELVEGLRARLEAPLDSEQYAMVRSCMLGSVDGYSPTRLPLEIELRRTVRENLYNLDYYLAHPEPDGDASQEVGEQVAEVFYVAQESLLAELVPLGEEADSARRAVLSGVLFGGMQHVLPYIGSLTTPMFKRPYTPDEMADLRAAAERAGPQARANLEAYALVWAESRPDVAPPLGLEGEATNAAHQVANALRQVFWDERPAFLSAKEQRQLDEATAARAAREASARSSAYEQAINPQVEIDPATGKLLRPEMPEGGAQ